MPPPRKKAGENVEAADSFTLTIARVELQNVYVISRTNTDSCPSTNNKTVAPPKERYMHWIEIFAVVKASVPNLEKKPPKETKYFLGYIGNDDLPNECLINRKKQILSRWDKSKWGELKFDWHQIMPFLCHEDPVLKQRAEKIDIVEHLKFPSILKSNETFCQYTNRIIKEKEFFPDTIEYKSSAINTRALIDGNWGAKLWGYEGTRRYQVTVSYNKQFKDSPGRVIEKAKIEGKTEQQASEELGITSKDYKKMQQVEKVDRKLLNFFNGLPNPTNILDIKEARKRFYKYKEVEKEACKEAGISIKEYRLLKSNLRSNDCYQYGIKPTVHRISVRSRNPNKYVSCLYSYLGVPWVFGPSGSPNPRGHQTELFQGIDCADLALGAARIAGITKKPYTYADDIAQNRKRLLTLPVIDGVFYMEMGKTLSITNAHVKNSPEVEMQFGIGKSKLQIGDLILFDWHPYDKRFDHTVILAGNKKGNVLTKLDKDTLIIGAGYNKWCHDGKGKPKSGPLTETLGQMIGRAHDKKAKFKVRRWRELASEQEIYVLLSGFKRWGNVKWNCTQAIAEKLHGRKIKINENVKGQQKVNALVTSIVTPVHWYDAADTLIEEINNGKYNIVISMGMKPFQNLNNIKENDLRFEMEPIAYNKNDPKAKDDRNENTLRALDQRRKGLLATILSDDPFKPTRNESSHTKDPKKVKDDGPARLVSNNTNGLPFSDIVKAINNRFPKAPITKLTDITGNKEIDYKQTKGEIKGFAYIDNNQGTRDYVCNQINYNLLYYSIKDNREDRFQHRLSAGFVHVPALDPAIYEKELIETTEIIIKTCAEKYLKNLLKD